MQQNNWQTHVQPPTLEEINAKVIARIKELEDDLKVKNLNIGFGIELEFFFLDQDKKICKDHVDLDWMKNIPFLEHAYKTIHGLHEIVLSAPNNRRKYFDHKFHQGKQNVLLGTHNWDTISYYTSTQIIEQLEALKKNLSEKFPKYRKTPYASFKALGPSQQTAGLHLNFSVSDKGNKNLFYDNHNLAENFSLLAQNCANKLLKLQKDGLILYAPRPKSYKRFYEYTYGSPPKTFATQSKNDSIMLRQSENVEDSYRIEDRLAGADANPYLVLLSGIGAIHDEITKHTQKIVHGGLTTPEPIIVPTQGPAKMYGIALKRFEKSELWKKIAGPQLHHDLVAYFKARGQQRASTTDL